MQERIWSSRCRLFFINWLNAVKFIAWITSQASSSPSDTIDRDNDCVLFSHFLFCGHVDSNFLPTSVCLLLYLRAHDPCLWCPSPICWPCTKFRNSSWENMNVDKLCRDEIQCRSPPTKIENVYWYLAVDSQRRFISLIRFNVIFRPLSLSLSVFNYKQYIVLR